MTHSLKRTIYVLALAACAAAVLAWPIVLAQSVMPAPKFTAYDSNGDPCNGCLLYAYAAGTTTPQDTFTDYALGTPNANPVVLDSAGRATVFVDQALSYKFTLKTSAGVDIWTVDNIVGQLSGVITVSAANTRGVQITRTGAESGLSIASSGGSGKTWGIASTTSGELKIQDDADGSPRIQLGAGEAINLVTTGTTTVSGAGGLNVTGGNMGIGTTVQVAKLNIPIGGATAESGSYGRGLQITGPGTNFGQMIGLVRSGVRVWSLGYAYNTSTFAVGNGQATDSDFTAAAASLTITTAGEVQAPLQPGIQVSNAGSDVVTAGNHTIVFDDESGTNREYDTGADYNNSTGVFTTPVAGVYLVCARVEFADNAASTWETDILANGAVHTLGSETAITAGVHQGCIMPPMGASESIYVRVTVGDAGGATILGDSQLSTRLSIRLMP